MTPLVEYKVDVVVPFADSLLNLESLKIWLKRDNIPTNFRIILVHDVQKQDLAGIELYELLSCLGKENFVYVKGQFGSPGAARNAGLIKTTAQWICFWDSDDYPAPQEFNSMIAAGIQNHSQICIGQFEIISHESREHIISVHGNSTISIATTPGFWRMAFLKESIGDVRFTNSRMGEDQLFLFSIDFASLHWHRHNAVVYQYVIGATSQLTRGTENYVNLLDTFSDSVHVCNKNSSLRSNYIYSIMQARIALTLLLKLTIRKTRGVLLNYIKVSFSSPKKIILSTIPAYATVVFDLFRQSILVIRHKIRSNDD
jgi:glycosyltransferase involved in cell wall biosynthesis